MTTVDLPALAPDEQVALLHALLDQMGSTDLSQCSDESLLEVAAANERAINKLTFQGDRQIVELSDRNAERRFGFRSVLDMMVVGLRVSEPMRRRKQMTATATFHGLTGEPLAPKYPTLAEAFAEGAVGPAHARVVIDVLDDIPHQVDHDIKVNAEKQMADYARVHTPAELTAIGARLMAHFDPDGELTDDTDRQQKRQVFLGRQDTQQMSKMTGKMTPECRADQEAVWAVWAAPGMNNPDDPDSPWGSVEDADPEKLAAAADRDTRSQAQRNHDAMQAVYKLALQSGELGESHRGLPVQLIIKADLTDLINETGHGVTATNSLLPITDVIRLAADAQPWLAVFGEHTTVPLYLGRARLASRGQRMALFAKPDGQVCSHPGCSQPAAHSEIHHATLDYAKGGLTNIDDLAPACPKHNRMVGDRLGQYTTGIYRDGPLAGRCWWRRNAAPGAPPNPKRVNKLPDVGPDFTAGLAKVRAEIHRQPPDPPDTGTPLPAGSTGAHDVVEIITWDPADVLKDAVTRSPSESRLRHLLTTRGL
ncbi:DUF222 domain-containing protein [Gordonia sp. DT219]|uniref:HNH endonuclease signature motif containing protein n=1 Tax=Gordonia sp. DT219 TaxID=3416658 RepID=UPI003CF7DE09